MDPVLFSSTLPKFEQEVQNPDLATTLKELSGLLNEDLIILSWNTSFIAVPMKISVQLPPRGNYEGIDIRTEEPVVIVFSLQSYPFVPPKVHTDRIDFPKDKIAHLYIAVNDKPPAFCLVRGGTLEWYSNKQIKDLIIRTENWLQDAASGELIEDGGQFDPLRLEGYSGTVIYDYNQLYRIINEKTSLHSKSNFAVGLFIITMNEGRVSYKLEDIVTGDNFQGIYDEFCKEQGSTSPWKKHYVFGYIAWSETGEVCADYLNNFPKDWFSLKQYCSHHGIDLSAFEDFVTKHDLNTFIWIPLICGIKRPTPIIGFTEDIEFINFTIELDLTNVSNGKIIDGASVNFYAHNQPLMIKKAKEISGLSASLGDRSLVVGCGALGSKIVMHFARSGSINLVLSDPDELSPHNLVRHALLSNSEGMNKAIALKTEIERMYPYEKLNLLIAPTPGDIFLTNPMIEHFKFILDFTASNSFLHSLIKAKTNGNTKIYRGYISDYGNLGILLMEGENRNPRVDDLQVFLYAQSRGVPSVSSWLKREMDSDNTAHLTVGVGCNSETVVLADDIVSLHGAFFSGIIKTQSQQCQNAGKIYLNEIITTPYFHNVPREINVPSVDVLNADNDPSWQIRFFPGIIDTIKSEMLTASPKETGGVFLGTANFKTRTIHVVEVIKSPKDSEANEVCFFRGIDGLSEAVGEINNLSGGQLGYIGEWHSHPHGPEEMSCVDAKTVEQFKEEFSELPSPLPVFLMIVTPDRLIPYVY